MWESELGYGKGKVKCGEVCWGVGGGVGKCCGRYEGCGEVLEEVWGLWRSFVRGVWGFPFQVAGSGGPPSYSKQLWAEADTAIGPLSNLWRVFQTMQ